jgi:TolB-like protein/Flp pilus assembly protein TadD
MSGFFEEVKRRKVYRVAAAYVIAAGFIIQIGSAVFPAWDLPSWTFRLVVVLLLLGFPIALILAWAFDVTPEGIKTTPALGVPGAPRRRNVFILVAIGLVISAAAGFFLLPRASARKIDKSIAVLPFENFSKEEENAFFADGIQDDILTNLSKIGDLKVISRTSVMGYRGKGANLKEIGKTLGVSTILEGSVRREGNRVRVTVQLINAANDEHIWGNNYDRDLTDVFAIQSDLAKDIAAELQAKLSPNEKAQMERKPTQNGEAYLAYVQAHDLHNRPDRFRDDTLKAIVLYERATKLDPNFALAFAGLSIVESWMYHGFDPVPARRDKARVAAEQALRLQPDLPEAHVARGFCYYYGDDNYERALAEFAIAQRSLPNNPEVYLAIGAIQRRQGKWAESTQNLEKAVALDPKDGFVLENLGYNYQATRDFETAGKIYERGLEVAPKSFTLLGAKAKLAMDWKGDLSVAEKLLAQVPPGLDMQGLITDSRISILILRRKFSEALQIVQQLDVEVLHGETSGATPKAYREGTLYLLLNEKEKARAAFEKALIVAQRLVSESPDDWSRHTQLGEILACLDRKDEAIREGKRGMELRPESTDAFDGPMATQGMAQIYTWIGDKDQAIALLEHLLAVPNGLTAPLLKLDPAWDSLRSDARFQALIDKYSAKI